MFYITEGDREGERKREREKDYSENEEESSLSILLKDLYLYFITLLKETLVTLI